MNKCPRCGKPTLNEGLCDDCLIEVEGIKYKDFKLVMCSVCGRVLYKNKWRDPSYIERIVREKIDKDWEILDIKVNKKLVVSVGRKDFVGNLVFNIDKRVCPSCSKKRGDYYEAILQVRGNKAKDIVEKEKRSEQIYKVVSQKNAMDYYFYLSKDAKLMLRKLKKRLNGEVKITRKLHSFDKQKSKKIYRLTILFREKE